MLLDLGPGMRTTSFIPDWQLRRDQGERRTSWYLRMWPPQRGADALGSLMRVEAPRELLKVLPFGDSDRLVVGHALDAVLAEAGGTRLLATYLERIAVQAER